MRDPLEMESLLENLQNLPTLPEVAMKVLHLAYRQETAVRELEEILQNDPALTAKVLRVANSAYYGLSRQVATLKTALVVLGLEETARLIRAITFLTTFPSVRVSGQFDYSRFWLHSITVAEVVRGMADRLGIADYSDASTGALLHDIGYLVLASFFEEDFIEVIQLAEAEEVSWLKAEERVIGLTHPGIGSILCKRWNLPETIRHVVRYHHTPLQAVKHHQHVYLGYLANRIAFHHGVNLAPEVHLTPLETDPVWQGLYRLQQSKNLPTPTELIAASEVEIRLGAELHDHLLG